jgi:UPF0176 protein
MDQRTNLFSITTFYKFIPIENVTATELFLRKTAKDCDISGLIILAPEGFNSTVSASTAKNLEQFKLQLLNYFNLSELNFKDSVSDIQPFRRFQIKVRDEIVTLNAPHLVPTESDKSHHLSPAEWNQVLKNEPQVRVVDTRNWYETQMGTFKTAINPKIDVFTDFPDFMKQQNIKKDEKVLIFCTGGIRCEKGLLQLQEQGFNQVYQLDGGILNYLQQFPNDQYEGECFVFDHRVAVDQNLKPSKIYDLCPHCGQPAKSEIVCKRCDSPQAVCDDCQKINWKQITCSKHCAHQLELHPDRKGPKQANPWRDTRQNK